MQTNNNHGPDTLKCPEATFFFSAFSLVDFYQLQPFLFLLATSESQKKNERKEKVINLMEKKSMQWKQNTTFNFIYFLILLSSKENKTSKTIFFSEKQMVPFFHALTQTNYFKMYLWGCITETLSGERKYLTIHK